MKKTITFKGQPLTLVGRTLKQGERAPNFMVTANDMSNVSLRDFDGKIKVITSFPSLDTPVCDLQVKEFNKKAAGISPDVVVLGISKDLPFAQERFCDANEIKNVKVLSDYKDTCFGINYGLLIKEWNLLGRSVLILDKTNALRYFQIVGEVTNQPDYKDALSNLEGVIKEPESPECEASRCKPCEEGAPPLPQEELKKLLSGRPNWELVDGKKIVKEFKFKGFGDAKLFLDLISVVAEEEGHHPNMTIIYNRVRITLTTHTARGLTNNDFIIAGIIDEMN